MKPIFTTHQSKTPAKKKAKAKKTKAAANEAASSSSVHVPTQPWVRKFEGLTKWKGHGAALVRGDCASPAMSGPAYQTDYADVAKCSDTRIAELIDEVLDNKPVAFCRRDSITTHTEWDKKRVSVTLAVFEAEDAKDKRLVFVDCSFLGDTQKLWAVGADVVVGSEKGYVNKVVNAPKAEEVTLLIAPYWISSEDVTYRRALRKIGRKA